MDITAIRVQIATVAGTVSGVRSASPRELDAIPPTPCFEVGSPSGSLSPGNRQVATLDFPMRLYVARVADESRTVKTIDDLFNATLVAFAAAMTLSGTVTECYISHFDFDRFYEVGREAYRAIDFNVRVVARETATYAP